MKYLYLSCFSLVAFFYSQNATSQLTEVWSSQFDGRGDYTDKFTCVVADNSGNIYAGGFTVEPGMNSNYLITKYNSAGVLLWKRVYNAPGDGPDSVKEIALDPSGNVIVTGYGNNVAVGNDFWTMKFSASGDSLWSRFFNDVNFNQYDEPNGLAIDASGNIIVTGDSDSDPTSGLDKDYLTVKYDANGNLIWSVKYDAAGGLDRAEDVAITTNGLIVVTGRSDNGNDDDFVTIAYNASGVQQWISAADNGGTDRASAIDADNAGGVVVVGRSDNGGNDDFLTVKYTSTGAITWSKFFDFVEDDRAELVEITDNGDIVVAGRSDGNATALINWNYRIVAYNSASTQLWTATYDGTALNDDIPTSLAISSIGDVVLTGYSDENNTATISNNIVTVLYSSNGTQTWNVSYDPSQNQNDESAAVTFDSNGNIIVVGNTQNAEGQSDALLLNYAGSGGGSVNTYTYNGIGDNTENIRDFGFDTQGNIYVAGYSVAKDADRNLCLVKMNSAGDTLWSRSITGTLYGSDEEANKLFVTSNSVIISGYVKNSGTGSEVLVAKYDLNGNLLWSSQYNSAFNESERSADMAVDATGNIYITGRTDIDPVSTSNNEILVQKYNTNGAIVWTNVVAGNTEDDRGKFIRLNGTNILVVARKHNGTNQDIWLRMLNSNGQTVWTTSYDSGFDDDVTDVEVDANNNIYITGFFLANGDLLNQDVVTLKYDAAGALVWSNVFLGAALGIDEPSALVTDGTGAVYVCGSSDNAAGSSVSLDWFVMKIANDGSTAWTSLNNDNANQDDIADDISLGSDNSPFVALHSDVDSGIDINYDWKVQHVSVSGDLLSSISYSQSDSTDAPNLMKWSNGDLFVGGSTWNGPEQRNKLMIKYSFIPESVNETFMASWEIFPNPAADKLYINTEELGADLHNYSIYDVSGRSVQSGLLRFPITQIELTNLKSGSYFIQLNSSVSTYTKSFIKQ
ncbi:MAG: hypothetical protein RL204_532 [Bacteroidota bacterium]|jgi:uncharacterized delta-60 repeat protein